MSLCLLFFIIFFAHAQANYILLPMDEVQKNHLKAYGVAYWSLQRDVEVTQLPRWYLHAEIRRRH